MIGTVTGGIQTTNNIYGNLENSVNVEGYSDQTAVASQYLTATGITATVIGRRVAYTIEGQRGVGLAFSSSTKMVTNGMKWDYKKSGTYLLCFDTWHHFDEAGSFLTKVVIYAPLGSQSVTLQLASPVVIGGKSISRHEQSFNQRDETEFDEHEDSFAGRNY